MLGHIYIVLWARLTNGDAIAKLRRSIQATNLSVTIGIISGNCLDIYVFYREFWKLFTDEMVRKFKYFVS